MTDSDPTCTWSSPHATSGGYPSSCDLAQWPESESNYCVLHDPSTGKPPSTINRALENLRAQTSSHIAEMYLRGVNDGSEFDFTDIQCTKGDIKDSSLKGATFTDSVFEDTSFCRSNLSNAVFTGGDFKNCDFTRANVNNADFSTTQTDCSHSTFIEARCNETDFKRANLSHTNFSGARLTNCFLQGANIQNSEFANATIRKVSIFWTNLESSNFTNAQIQESDFTAVDATNVRFFGAIIRETNFVGAELAGASFTDANLTGSVNFGHRLLQEHDADWLAGTSSTRSQFNVPEGPDADNRYGRTAMRAEMGEDQWWNSDATACKNPGQSALQTYYSTSSIREHLFGDWRMYSLSTWVTRLGRKLLSSSEVVRKAKNNLLNGNDGDFDDSCQIKKLRTQELSKLEQAEKIYGELEAAYTGTTWDKSRRRLNFRRQESRRKRLEFISYPRQWLMKWSMQYGESPLYVLGTALGLAVVAAVLFPVDGIQIDGALVQYGWPEKGLNQSVRYAVSIVNFSLHLLISDDIAGIKPNGTGKTISFSLMVAGRLLFAMFVYTLGRRAVS